MREIIIKTLCYSNFRGQTREIEFSEGTTLISGHNKAGKSTAFNALLQLLRGVDKYERTNYELFDNTLEFTPENAKTANIEGVFEIDGEERNFRKTATQKWVRKRGESTLEKAANDDYKFYVDNVQVTANEYKKEIESTFAPLDVLGIIINANLWRVIDWKELRGLLQNIVGEIKNEDFKTDYTDVIAEIEDKGVEAAKTMYHKLIKSKDVENPGYERRRDVLETKIEAQKNILPNLAEIREAEIRIEQLTNEIAELDKQILGLRAPNEALIAKRAEEEALIAQKKREMQDEGAEYERKRMDEEAALIRKYRDAESNNKIVDRQCNGLRKSIEDANSRLVATEAERETLLKELKHVRNRTYDGICVFCGSKMDGKAYTEGYDKFKAKKAADEAAIISKGKPLGEKIELIKAEIAKYEEDLENTKCVNLRPLSEAVSKQKLVPVWIATERYKEMTAEIAELESKKTEIIINESALELQARKAALMDEQQKLHPIAARRKTLTDAEGCIAIMEAQLKSVIEALADCERKEMLCEQYMNEESEIIRMRVNQYLPPNIRVEIRKRKKDGTFEPTCRIVIDKVNALSTNTGDEYKIGIALSEAFQKWAGIHMPIFLDDVEHLDSFNQPKYNGQLVLLKVSDDEFKVEKI